MQVFLFTDIEGSTRLWEEHTGEMGAVISRHDAILREQIEGCGGLLTKHTGDGVTAAFEGGEPISCAVEAQKRFAQEPWGQVGELRIRVGLHGGPAEWISGEEPSAGDYFGPAVNCAARIMSAAWGGQVLLTPEVISIASLPEKASTLDLGKHLLKNVTAPQQILQLLHPELPWHEFPPPRTLSGQSIRRAMDQRGTHIAGLAPPAMAVALVGATLVPILQGDLSPNSPDLLANLGVLDDLGVAALRGIATEFVARMQARREDGRETSTSQIQQELEGELLERLAGSGETALALRTDASRLLQAVHGVEAAMTAATDDVKAALARGLSDLGVQFGEFRWMLAGVQDTLAEMSVLQRRHLAMTEEILQFQREKTRVTPAPPLLAAEPPAFLEDGEEAFEPPVFVAREAEIARLDSFLERALASQGGVFLVLGGPGRGKTALLSEFAWRALDAIPELLVASGTCDAYSGVGDPYLPFREVLEMLTGDVEARWAAGAISHDHARRLWQALPDAVEALLAHGPHVVPALVPGEPLLARATAADLAELWLARLRERVERRPGAADGLEQSHLFQQVSNVLRALSQAHPLLLLLDDLQWVDRASAGLLFHLGRRLEGARILIAGAYRPEELALDRHGEPHPLDKALVEFKRLYGDVWLDLAKVAAPEGRRFIDAYLETEPNLLGEGFRQKLAERAGGHPLFTVELLRAMQERGDLVRDDAGCWIEGTALDWDVLPSRVEGVIAARIERLGEDLRHVLTVASVEGEDFTAEVVAGVQNLEARALVRRLSGELQREHRLVRAQGLRRIGSQRLALYRFQHHLFQKYLYNHLDEAERAYLHEDVGTVLEALYDGQTDQVAVQLARHFLEAGVTEKAAHYLGRAGVLAAERYANEEALAYLSRALEYLPDDAPQRLDLLAARAKVYGLVAQFETQRADLEAVLDLAEALGNEAHRCDALIALAECLWGTGDAECRELAERAAEIARKTNDPLREGRALRFLGWHDAVGGHSFRGRNTLEASLARFEQTGQLDETAACLADLSLVLSWVDEPSAALDAAEKAVALSRETGDRRQEAIILRRLAAVRNHQREFVAALTAVQAALNLHREIGDRDEECHGLSVLGITLGSLGKHDEAAGAFQQMLELAEETGSARGIDWGVSNMVHFVFCPRGEHEAGLAFLETRLARARQAKQQYVAAQIQLLRVRLLLTLGQQELALEVARSVLPDADRFLHYADQQWLLQLVGRCQAELGRFHQAQESFQGGLERTEKCSEPVWAAIFRLDMADVTYQEGDQDRLRTAMEQLPRRDLVLPTSWSYHRKSARLHLAIGDLEQALESSNRALQDMEIEGEGWWVEQCHLTHSRVLRALGRGAEADDYLRRAYERVMLVAGKTQDEDLRQSWLENVPDNREIVAEWEARGEHAHG